MAEKPITCTTWEVQALLDGRKTQTRRVIKPQPIYDYSYYTPESRQWFWTERDADDDMMGWWPSYEKGLTPKYQLGDILWVKEKWLRLDSCTYCMCDDEPDDQNGCYLYYATHGDAEGLKWGNPRYMPRAAARIFLRVTDVRVERVQEITYGDCCAEGVFSKTDLKSCFDGSVATEKYRELWDTLNAKRRYGWETNPWVWVYTFERVNGSEVEPK